MKLTIPGCDSCRSLEVMNAVGAELGARGFERGHYRCELCGCAWLVFLEQPTPGRFTVRFSWQEPV